MAIKELIEKLKNFDEDLEVVICNTSGVTTYEDIDTVHLSNKNQMKYSGYVPEHWSDCDYLIITN